MTNLQPESYVGPISIFYISKSSDVNIDIACPLWYGHTTEYASPSSGSGQITDIRYQCNPCSDNYYTTSKPDNMFSYSASGNNTGTGTEARNTASYSCIKCPYGAVCTGNNVMPRPNYWGYWHESELVFLQCPAGYCCSGSESSPCKVYDYCAGNKTGTLCGECQEGFSVSILTGACTPNSNCGNDDWFWLFAVLVAMAYALWYTLKADIFALLFTIIAYFRRFCYKSKSKINIVKPVAANDSNSMENMKENHASVGYDSSRDDNVTPKGEGESDDEDVDKGYFGIVTYYVQMAAVIMIEIEFSDVEEGESVLDTIVEYIDRFLNLELTQMSFDVCPILGLTTLGKHFYSLGFLFGTYLCWLVIFICVLGVIMICNRMGKMDIFVGKLKSFKMKLVTGIVEIIKYTYTGFCDLIFMSLACTKLGNNYVWWYDGTNVCLENIFCNFCCILCISISIFLGSWIKIAQKE